MALNITDDTFESVLKTDKLVLIDFSATWCGPCKQLSPIIDELHNEYTNRVVIGKVDIEENNDIVNKYSIRNVPTLLFIKNGKLLDRMVGAQTKSILIETINKNM